MRLPPFPRPPFADPRLHLANAHDVTATINDTLSRAFRAAGLAPETESRIATTIEDPLAAAGLRGGALAPGAGRTYDATATVAANDELQSVTLVPSDEPAQAVVGDARAPAADATRGRFTAGTFTNAAGTRRYKLYVPASLPGETTDRLLVVMLHGCTQSPDDFAAGTRMNALAEREGLIVLYPAQDAGANGSRCWNWFRPQDQERDRGEPAIIAGMAREIAQAQGVASGAVFAAGLSAGAAMAVTLGATYPDVFAAVGAHSGLAHRAARDVPSAFAAMHGRAAMKGRSPAHATAATPRAGALVPTIVFHGSADTTVTPRNGAAIVETLVAGATPQALRAVTHTGRTSDGTAYQRVVYEDETGHPLVEQWTLDGVGHAWSGGSAEGSYTHPGGPDASVEMIRFFRAQSRTREH